MPIPIVYRKSGENGIASYDWFDIADGVGYITLYGAKDQASFVLLRSLNYSDKVETRGNCAGDDTNPVFDADFDLILNTPKVVKGALLVSMPAYAIGSGTPTQWVFIDVKFRKWDGTTETEIAAASSAILKQVQGTGINHEKRFLVNCQIPRTKFKKGDIIRTTILGHAWANGSSRYAFGHDPESREATDVSTAADTAILGTNTQMVVNMPFEVDL